jgi:hypothetical protein
MSPTDTRMERRVIETLQAKSAQLPERAVPAFDPGLSSAVDRDDGQRRSRLLAAVAAGVLVAALAAGVTFAFVGRETDQPAREPGTPVATITIEALPTLTYQATEFTTEPGINEIVFVDSAGGTHRLVFADPALADVKLDRERPRARVRLERGRDYTVFCAVPGHRAAGMEAVIHVRPTKGPIPVNPPTRPDGSVDTTRLPDFISVVTGRPGTIGYVKKEVLFERATDGPQTVYGKDLETVIGHMYPGRGFVPLGQDPESVPTVPSSTVTASTVP